jgi:hypothetical protein
MLKRILVVYVTPRPAPSDMILSALGQARTVLFLGFTPKGLMPFRESMIYINTSPFSHPSDVRRHNTLYFIK